MVIYIRGFAFPRGALVPHLAVVTLPFASLILTRLAIARWVSNSGFSIWLAAALSSLSLAAMTFYYGLVIGGLKSWGGVISWNVISTYATQAPALLRALGFAPMTAATVAITTFAVLLSSSRLYLRRFDWTRRAVHPLSATALALLLLAGCGILGALMYQFSTQPWTKELEPVSLTLFQEPSSGVDLEGHMLDRLTAATLDRREDEARATYMPAPPGERRNLVLIVIDAQRPDHMGVYGYARDTTPGLSSLALTHPMRKVEFVHSSCPDTACGMLSLSSSKFPRQFSFRPFTLHQVMRRNGYRVDMILSGDHSHFYSLKSFYGEVDSFYDGAQAKGYFMNDDQLVLDRLAAMPAWDGTPGMLQLHLMSTHILSKHDEADARFTPAATYVLRGSNSDIGSASIHDERAINYYDNGVLKSDRTVQSVLDRLGAKGYLKNTLVVITADHGESLGEHGLFVHANSVREEVLRIPLLMISYGYEPERPLLPRAAPAQVDIAPTILAELGLPVPRTWAGRALQGPPETDFVYFEGHGNFGLIDRRDPAHTWKYWVHARTGAEYAFDLSTDPGETRNELNEASIERRRTPWRLQVLSGTSLAL
jgi:glucan phosphoethanolaminetransferase (alkaline phosphatase superfamily)